jgi:dihydrofolate reductase
MRELITSTFLTLDGVMQAPGGPREDERDGFPFGGWSVHHWDDRMAEVMNEQLREPFDLVLGRRTYEIFAAHWPHAPEEEARVFNDATKYVASRGRPNLRWRNSVLLDGDAGDAVAALKRQEGPALQVHGSGDLIQTLLRRGLIDRFHIWVFPVVLGPGRRLFADGTMPGNLRLVESQISTTGVVMATYEPAGDVVTGSFALDA